MEALEYMIGSTSWVAILVVPLVTCLMLHYAATAKAKRTRGAVVFPATGLAVLCGISLVFAVCIIAGGWNQNARLTTTVIGIVWILFSLLLWPRTIVIDADSVTAKHIWRPAKRMTFEEVDYVSRRSNREAVIYGNGKTKEIAVSQHHVAAEELEAELRKRGVKYYAEASG